ncbi:MAG: hypothetical protein AVDCRST_MAG68-4602, partial [uncultured Gemmatimonadetes bacterium]
GYRGRGQPGPRRHARLPPGGPSRLRAAAQGRRGRAGRPGARVQRPGGLVPPGPDHGAGRRRRRAGGVRMVGPAGLGGAPGGRLVRRRAARRHPRRPVGPHDRPEPPLRLPGGARRASRAGRGRHDPLRFVARRARAAGPQRRVRGLQVRPPHAGRGHRRGVPGAPLLRRAPGHPRHPGQPRRHARRRPLRLDLDGSGRRADRGPLLQRRARAQRKRHLPVL